MLPFLDTIQRGDSFQLVKQLPDKSVDLILTDPPYFLNGTSGYGGAKWDSISSIIPAGYNLNETNFATLRPSYKSIFAELAVNDYFEKVVHSFLPKLKPSGTFICFNRPENIKTMKLQIFKPIVTKTEYLEDTGSLKDYRENIRRWALDQDIEWFKLGANPTLDELSKSEYALVALGYLSGLKLPSAVSKYFTSVGKLSPNLYPAHTPANENSIYGRNTGHLTPKPYSVWRDIIRKYSEVGDVIFDPFSGSGTTALTSYDLNRHFIAFEYDQEQVDKSRERLEFFKTNMPKSAFPTEIGTIPSYIFPSKPGDIEYLPV